MSKPDLTAEEFDRFKKHLQDPEFVQLFGQYAKDLQDPKHSTELNEYLKQLEAEQQSESVYGKGVQLIVPEPSFVIKTKDVTGSHRVYINICTSPKVDDMRVEACEGDSGPRQHMNLPMVTHSKEAKRGAAPDGGPQLVWDMAVNPNAAAAAARNHRILDTMAIMAIERVEQLHGSALLRAYKMPRLKYKGVPGAEQPSVMAVRSGEGGEVVDGRLRPSTEAQAASTATAAGPPLDTSTQRDSSSSGSGSSFSFGSKGRSAANDQDAFAVTDPCTAGYKHACGAVTPSWKLVEQHKADLGNSWGDMGRGLRASSNAPQAVVVKVDMPGVETAAGLHLHVGSDAVHLEAPGKYILDLTAVQLKHAVLPDKGSAKFDKHKQQLTLTLEVVPKERLEQQTPGASKTQGRLHQQHEQATPCGSASGSSCDVSSDTVCTAGPGDIDERPGSPSTSNTADDAHAFVRRIKAASKTANQLRWEQLHSTLDRQAFAEQQEGAVHPHSPQQVLQQGQQQQQQRPEARAAVLKPRLLSGQIDAADLDKQLDACHGSG